MVKRILKKKEIMAIIYTFPTKATPAGNDLILISDSADSNKTKQIKVSSLPSSGAGITLTTTGTSGVATLTGSVLNIPNYATGGTPSLPLNGVQYRNANGNFEASSNLIFDTNTLTVEHTAVIKGQGNLLPAGRLKLNCEQNSNAITLEGPANSGGANYTLKFPSPAPTNNQILEYTTSGDLGWINTPTGSGDTYTLGAGVKAGISIPLTLDAATGSDSTVNFKEGANITLTSSGATEITIASSSSEVGFSPMSIYEGQDLVGSGGAGGIGSVVTFARQTVVENECTIDSVDFFRLEGDQDISVHVYEGTIANAASANLVLSGTESGGNINEINKLTFNKSGYARHTFNAGTSVVILVSFDYVGVTEYSNAVGHNDLYRLPNLSASGAVYYNVNNIPTTLNAALDQLQEGNQYGVSLHFYNN